MTEVDDEVAELLRRAAACDTSQFALSHRGERLAGLGDGGPPIATMSVTKLIVGMIIGRAVRLGLLDLDQPVSRWFPQWSDRPKSIITVRQVMGHASGLAADTWPQLNADWPDDLLAHTLNDLPVAAEPGTVLAYNNVAVSVLPAIITRVAGRPFLDFAATELFRPLGIETWTWQSDNAGNPLAMASAAFTAADLAKLGELLTHDDDQLLPADWVDTIRRSPIPGAGMGLLLLHRWPADRPGEGAPIAYGHDGSEGQHLWIYPASGLVVARLKDCGLAAGRFEPSTPDQVFLDLPQAAGPLDAALAPG
ncbi:serine hydrolase domain-containing protein [Microlunatus speluncae]|uniref:serine hydrolase domain-containing protein n=1 Tax=Microlunatus speluncae TaxID=2594267 RepID=UPI0012662C46|nr:serine hydrolase [Microlunatus speluncae]